MIDNYTLHGYHKRVHIVTMRIATERRGGFLPSAYAYNLRSWVTHISSPLFSQRLSYGEPSDGGQPRYGGGVSAMDWQAAGDSLRGYRYQYDALGRLAAADYREGGLPSDRYVTEYSYDLMGNILTLSRSGKVYDEIYGITDDLTYQYDGNRLIRVTNHAADTPAYKDAMYYADGADLDTERTYDANGNMTSNADSRISRISYDALNMPCRIDYIDGSHIDYTYAADGAKQRVDYYLNPYTSSLPDDDLGTACDSSLLVHTWREYAGNCVYVCDTLSMILIDGGYITFDYATHQPIYHYYLKDYLGNNRITVSLADGRIEEVNHYYPFGGLMGDSRNATTQPYKYIGKELDRTHGLNWYDHGARHYDPVTGRWNTMDPMCEKYYEESPYASCHDNPILYKDSNGKIAIIDNIIGAAVGAGVELASQVISSVLTGESINVKWGAVAIAAGEGLITSGGSTLIKVGGHIVSAVANSAIDNMDRGVNAVAIGTGKNLVEGVIGKGISSKVQKAVRARVSHWAAKGINSRSAMKKSMQKTLGINAKKADKIAKNINEIQRKMPKTATKVLGDTVVKTVMQVCDKINKMDENETK